MEVQNVVLLGTCILNNLQKVGYRQIKQCRHFTAITESLYLFWM